MISTFVSLQLSNLELEETKVNLKSCMILAILINRSKSLFPSLPIKSIFSCLRRFIFVVQKDTSIQKV